MQVHPYGDCICPVVWATGLELEADMGQDFSCGPPGAATLAEGLELEPAVGQGAC